MKLPRTRSRSACDGCARAKARCSSSVPCHRCQEKGISCEKKALREPVNASTDPAEAKDAPENPSKTHYELDRQLDGSNTDIVSDISFLAGSQLPAIPESFTGSQDNPLDVQSTQGLYDFIFDSPPQPSTQGLRVDMLDFSAFPVNALSDLSSAPTGRVGGDFVLNDSFENSKNGSGVELDDPSDSWHTYRRRSGMVQADLWHGDRDRDSSTGGVSGGAQALPRSILDLLDLDSILAMEEHDHVARVRPEQVQQLTRFIKRIQHQPSSACPPSCSRLLGAPQVINALVQLYFEHFHPTFPLLHRATFNTLELPTLLLLATTAIGSRYSKIPQPQTLSVVLGDILRRAIDAMVRKRISH